MEAEAEVNSLTAAAAAAAAASQAAVGSAMEGSVASAPAAPGAVADTAPDTPAASWAATPCAGSAGAGPGGTPLPGTGVVAGAAAAVASASGPSPLLSAEAGFGAAITKATRPGPEASPAVASAAVASDAGSSSSSSSKVPPQPPSCISNSTENPISRCLAHLTDVVAQAAAEGRLSDEALAQAATSCDAVIQLSVDEWYEVSAAALAAPQKRGAVMGLLAFVVRQLLQASFPLQDPLKYGCLLRIFSTLFSVVNRGLNACLKPVRVLGTRSAVRGDTYDAAAEVIRLLVRTDLVQCLARLLAAITSATAGEAASAAEVWDMFQRTGSLKQAEEACTVWLRCLTGAASSVQFLMLLCANVAFEDHQGLQAALCQLRGAVLRSRLLEHEARLVVLTLRRAAARASLTAIARSGNVAATGAPNGPSMGVGLISRALQELYACLQKVQNAEADIASDVLTLLVQAHLRNFASTQVDDRAHAVWTDAVVAGPCVQFFLLLHVVSQLCAADGGSDYGLPAGARMPAVVSSSAEVGSPGGSNTAAPQPLEVGLMAYVFAWWARNTRTRPCSDRALRAVCERAVAAANASLAVDGAAGGAADGGGSAARGYCFSPPEDAKALALAALNCAIVVTKGGAAGDFRGLWAAVMQTANTATHVRANPTLAGGLTPLPLLVEVSLPPLGGALTDTGSLPPQPGPDLAAALAAGYVPALERTLRHEARLAGSSAQQLAVVLRGVSSLLEQGGRCGLASLMAYGEPNQVAALLATAAKLVAAVAIDAGGDTLTAQFVQLPGARQALRLWDGRGSGPADHLWWQRQHSSGMGSGGSAAAALSLGSRGAAESGSAAAGTSGTAAGSWSEGSEGSEGTGGVSNSGSGNSARGTGSSASGGVGVGDRAAPLAPLQQLSLVATFGLARLLTALNKIVGRRMEALHVMLQGWLPPLLHAYLHCSRPAGPGGGTEGTHAPRRTAGCGPGAADGAAAVAAAAAGPEAGEGGGADLRSAAASWERLLLGELDVPGMVEKASHAVIKINAGRVSAHVLNWLAEALLPLLVAFPEQGRRVLRGQMREQGREAVSLLNWLRGALPTANGGNSLSTAVRHLLELAPAVAGGGEPSAADLARLRSEGGWAARVGSLLPPPCFVATALSGLQLCSNPGCSDLKGDSEAGLVQGGRKAGGGGACYCSRACQLAHLRAGGQEEGAPAAARGRRRRGGG